jgi:formamidopyrimidine-DNA glycosylase
MPELAEVDYFRKRWNPGLGETVVDVEVHPQARIFRETDPAALKRHLTGLRLPRPSRCCLNRRRTAGWVSILA